MLGSKRGGSLCVAVVEDNEANARLVHDVLSAHGFRVEVFTTGLDGVSGIPATRPDALLLDIQLPDIDGVEVLRRLRSAGVEVPAIAVTAFAMKGDREVLLDSGFDEYLAKPLDIVALASSVAAVIDPGES